VLAGITGFVLTFTRMLDYLIVQGEDNQQEWSVLIDLIFSILKYAIELVISTLFV
jgi:hypothetical protein